MRNKSKHLILILILVLIAAVAGTGTWKYLSKERRAESAAPAAAETVSYGAASYEAAAETAGSGETPAQEAGRTKAADEALLTVTDLDVGKADCAVIRYKGNTGMIDTGTEESFYAIDSFLKKNGITGIDYLILTHYHQDHIGSAVKILQSYPVKEVYCADYVSDKKYYAPLMKELKDRDNVFFVDQDISFDVYELKVEIIPASDPEPLIEDENNKDNNMSLMTRLTLGDRRLLFTADIEKDRIAQILDSDEDISADWIKTPHHGDFQKKQKKLYERVDPEYAVISTSYERVPEEGLIECLEEMDIPYYTTMDKDVTTVCDGHEIKVEQGE